MGKPNTQSSKTETLFNENCSNKKCVYNLNFICKCRNIDNECISYKK